MSASAETSWDSNVRQLIRRSGMPISMFAEAVGRRNDEALSWWSGTGTGLNYSNLSSMSQYLGVSIEDLMQGSCDTELIRGRIFEGPHVLPEVYRQHASSFVRTSGHIMDYLSLMYGRHFVDRILLNLNIHPLFFDKLENRINLLFFITFLNELSNNGLSDDEIASLACYVFLRLRKTPIGRQFAAAKNYVESYHVLARDMTLFESNFSYKFEVSESHIRIIAKPTEAMQFLAKMDPKAYGRLFAYRRKVIGWFPLLSNLSPVNLHVTKCVMRGDSETVYDAETPADPHRFANLRLVDSGALL